MKTSFDISHLRNEIAHRPISPTCTVDPTTYTETSKSRAPSGFQRLFYAKNTNPFTARAVFVPSTVLGYVGYKNEYVIVRTLKKPGVKKQGVGGAKTKKNPAQQRN